VRFLSSATKAVTANSFTVKVRSVSCSAALRVISTEKSVKSATASVNNTDRPVGGFLMGDSS